MSTGKNNGAYDLSLFEPRAAGSAAPQRRQQTQRPAPPKLVPKPKKSSAQLREESLETTRQTIKVLLISGLLLMFLGLLIYSRVQLDELNRSYEKTQSQLSIVQAENTRLHSALQSRVSLDRVEDYAKNQLGMVKQESYQVQCVDLSGADSVTVSGAKKSQPQEEGFLAKWNAFLSYIF